MIAEQDPYGEQTTAKLQPYAPTGSGGPGAPPPLPGTSPTTAPAPAPAPIQPIAAPKPVLSPDAGATAAIPGGAPTITSAVPQPPPVPTPTPGMGAGANATPLPVNPNPQPQSFVPDQRGAIQPGEFRSMDHQTSMGTRPPSRSDMNGDGMFDSGPMAGMPLGGTSASTRPPVGRPPLRRPGARPMNLGTRPVGAAPISAAPGGSMITTMAPPALPSGPPPSGGPGVRTSRIDPYNDLRSTQIVSEDDPRTSSFASRVDSAAGRLPGNRFGRARAMADDVYSQFGDLDVGTQDVRPGDVRSGRVGTRNVQGRDVGYGPEVGPGMSEEGALGELNAGVTGAARRAAGNDRASMVRSARGELSDFLDPDQVQAGAGVSPEQSARLARYGSMTDDAASKLAAVDRFELAKQKLKEFRDSTAADYDLDLRKATDLSAQMGQGRSGIQRTRYGNIALDRERDLRGQESRLLTEALEGTIGDQFNKTSALRGLEEGIAGEERAVRGEERGERDYFTNVNEGNVNRSNRARELAASQASSEGSANFGSDLDTLGALASVQGATAGREAGRRGEMRGERDRRTDIETRNVERQLGIDTDNINRQLAVDTGNVDRDLAVDTGNVNRRFSADTDNVNRRRAVDEGNIDRRVSARMAALNAGDRFAGAETDDAYRELDALSGLEGRARAVGNDRADQMRGERDFQNSQEQKAFERRFLQDRTERQDMLTDQDRALDLLRAGEAGNPADTLAQLADGGMDPAIIQQLAASIAARQQAGGGQQQDIPWLTPEMIEGITPGGI